MKSCAARVPAGSDAERGTRPEAFAASARSGKRLADRPAALPVLLFCSLFFSFAYFNHLAAGWNVNTRLALVYAIVERGTVAIDSYHDSPAMPFLQTMDKAFYNGHFYCDKSPALSFLAVPLYTLLWKAKMAWGATPDWNQSQWVFWTRYLLRTTTVSLAAALLGVLLWKLARRFGVGGRAAFALSFTLLWGTALSGYSTLFFPYLPSALCVMAGYGLLLDARLRDRDGRSRGTSEAPVAARGTRLFWVGLLLGMACFLEYTAGLACAGVGLYAVWVLRRRPLALWRLFAGGLIPTAALFAYAYGIFGQFSIPYKYEYDDFFRQEMAKGFQGIHLPRLAVLYYITVHPFQGILFYSPVLLLAFGGIWRAFRNRGNRAFRPDVILSVCVVAAYLTFNSGYYLWWGGWASAPRHLCLAIPFFLAPIALYLRGSATRGKTGFFLILCAVSFALNFMITAVEPQCPPGLDKEALMNARIGDNLPSPAVLALYPRFLRGEVARNLGYEALALPRRWSLVPLYLFWLALGAFLVPRARIPDE